MTINTELTFDQPGVFGLAISDVAWFLGAGWSAVGKRFSHDIQTLCLNTVAHLHFPQHGGIKDNGFEMEVSTARTCRCAWLHLSALNYRAICKPSLTDFHPREAGVPADQGPRTGPQAT